MLPGSDVNMSIKTALQAAGYRVSDFEKIAVTGGRYRDLQTEVEGVPLIKVPEIEAIGRGGFHLANLDHALVVSAGTGTAMVAASMEGSRHLTGSAVGGGTLIGLSQLLLGTSDAVSIDRLAASGDANQVDLTLKEAIGGTVGRLPIDANAVNFGKPKDTLTLALQRGHRCWTYQAGSTGNRRHRHQCCRICGFDDIVFTGHLIDLPQVRRELHTTAGYYNQHFILPDNPGTAVPVQGRLFPGRPGHSFLFPGPSAQLRINHDQE